MFRVTINLTGDDAPITMDLPDESAARRAAHGFITGPVHSPDGTLYPLHRVASVTVTPVEPEKKRGK